jgi:Eco29kI restriction endonuclease
MTDMKKTAFDRREHVYRNDALVELIKDSVRFFNGTPVHKVTPPERFAGTGVYALYYTGSNTLYARYAELNRLSYDYPIYVGKAVPRGWRQSRVTGEETSQSAELFSRIREHGRNINAADGLEITDFSCRFVIFESAGSDMIGTIEAALIKLNRPLWNSVVDGFGNHTPGNGRFDQAKSQWDVLHPGRRWAEQCRGNAPKKEQILKLVATHMASLGVPK